MSDASATDWETLARAWVEADPDPATRAELETLIAGGDRDGLAERMRAGLTFGTAGLRGIVGAGPNRMNQAVVIRVSSGLAGYLLERVVDSRALPVVVGFDARASSRELAEATAGVLVAAGLHVRYFEAPVPTPLVAYAAKQLGAIAAVVITASHNPAAYNGYKVYGANAAQLGAPADAEVAKRAAAAGPANAIRRAMAVFDGRHPMAEPLSEALFERYLAEVDLVRTVPPAVSGLRIVYTPLHGVGGRFVERAFRRAGYTSFAVVPSQAEPDGLFPTVAYPNPEEPGVLAIAEAQAAASKAQLVIANDPDADRLSVSLPTPAGRFEQLTGDQVGVLLGDYLLARASRTPVPLVVASLVSSPMISMVAAAHGAAFERTLTGFKWICNAGLALERESGVRFLFGYEEALGYAVPVVRDKDGMSAALLFADLVGDCEASGRSVREKLDGLYRQHGLWVSCPRSIQLPGRGGGERIAAAMQLVRRAPPERVGGCRVECVVDFAANANGRPQWLGEADLIELTLQGGHRVLIRPSGTEPKLKLYVHAFRSLRSREPSRAAEAEVLAFADQLGREVAHHLELC